VNAERRRLSETSTAPARYELTVDGRIGPVLRRALRLPGGEVARTCIVVRAAGPDDLVGLMRVLGAHGLEVDNVSRLPTRAPDE
jgi:hypothetical protein